MRPRWLVGALAASLVLTGACADIGDSGAASSTATPAATATPSGEDGPGSTASPTPSDTDQRPDGDPATSDGDGSTDGAAGTTDPGDGEAGQDADTPEGRGAGADGDAGETVLAAEDVCRRLPAREVAAALGVDSVAASPGTSDTPQCSYAFRTDDGIATDATVAALRPEEDLGGRRGEAAFDHVVERNRRATPGAEPRMTELDVGDRAVLLSGDNLHLGVVQLGWRVVTTIVHTEVADAAAASALARTADVLAPR